LAFEPKAAANTLSAVFRRFDLESKQKLGEVEFSGVWLQYEKPAQDTQSQAAIVPKLGFTVECASFEEQELVKLAEHNLSNLPFGFKGIEVLPHGHHEASLARDLYMAHFREQIFNLETLLQEVRNPGLMRSFHYALLPEQIETTEAELHVWRVRKSPPEAFAHPRRGFRQVLAWHGEPMDVDPFALIKGELKPLGRGLADEALLLSQRPLQTFGKGPEWTVFYLCLALVQDSEMGRNVKLAGDRVLPLYCIMHPSLWYVFPDSMWP